MPEIAASTVGLTILAVAEVPNMYSGLLPSLFTISTFREDEEHTKYWIRRGEVLASALSLAFGAGASLVSNSWAPLIGVLLMMVYLVFSYEYALRKGPGNSSASRGMRDLSSVQ